MNFSKSADIVTLVANVGVLIGVLFLIVEIRQANQIATRDSRDDITDSYIQNNGFALENTELAALRAKLRNPSPNLTDLEKEQASLIADNQFFVWSKIRIGLDADLLPELNARGYIARAHTFMKKYPGLIPYVEDVFVAADITMQGTDSRIYRAIWEEIEASR